MPGQDEPPDLYALLEPLVTERPEMNPWVLISPGSMQYFPDYTLLEAMLGVPIGERAGSQSGRLAKAADARILPREVDLFVKSLPATIRSAAAASLTRNRAVTPSDARILGRAYVKQIDVLIAQWSRGAELLVSTKTMVASFRKNLANRFEEAYGDAKNLRGRYPLVAMGFLFVLRSTALAEPGTVERAIDMLRKLKAEDAVLQRTPVEMHVEVRQRREHRNLPLDEGDTL